MSLDPKAFKSLSRVLAPSGGGALADRALIEKLITPEQLRSCVEEQERSGRSLDEILQERGFLKPEDTLRLQSPSLPAAVVEAARDPERKVGHYVLVERVGQGGMAEVWKAWDRSLGRWVAMKFLKEEVGHPTQRIEREGRMAGQISHPGVIRIYERGHHGGRPFLVMPFVDGAPPKAPLPPAEAARVALEAARALTHVHQAGVIHRDVKPANLLVDSAGRVVLADFGLAIPADDPGAGWTLSGTLEYASPEQIRGEALDPRTDVYSLGATLYQLLSGKPPPAGGAPPELPGLPKRLRAALARALAPRPAERFDSMDGFARALEEALEGMRRPRRASWVLAAVLALVGLGSSLLTYALLRAQLRAESRREAERHLEEGRGRLLAGERLLADPEASTSSVTSAIAGALAPLRVAFNLGGDTRTEAGLALGRAYELMGAGSRAEGVYREMLPSPAGHAGLARLLLRRLPEGVDVANRLSTHAGKSEDAELQELARAAVEGRWAELLARAGREEAVDDLRPLAAAWAALKLERKDEARRWGERAFRARRSDANAAFVFARAARETGDVAAARAAYEHALRVAPPGWTLLAEASLALRELKKE